MMRRPLMYLTLAYAAGIAVSYYIGTGAAFCIAGSAAVSWMLRKEGGKRNKGILPVIITGACLGIVCFAFSETEDSILQHFSEQTGTMEADVVQAEQHENENGRYMQLKVKAVDWNGTKLDKPETVLVKLYENDGKDDDTFEKIMRDVVPGDRIIAKGEITIPQGRRNPGCFDYALYLRSQDIRVCMTASYIERYDDGGEHTISGRLHIVRETFLKRLEASAGKKTAGLMRGILFGGKTQMDEEVLEDFQKNGTAHVLAVSGLHVGIIYGFIAALWKWKKGILFFIFVMSFFSCYMVMASFSPSVVRAVFMVALHMTAKLTNRRYDLSSAAFLMAFIMLLKNPMQIFHAGFQMSFLAVLTLSLIIPVIRRFYDGILLASLSIQLGLLPYMMYVFNYLSLAAVLVNIPIVFLTGIIVPAGLCSLLVMELNEPMFQLISGIVFGLCEILTRINAATGIDGITVFTVASPSLILISAYYFILLFFVSEDGRLAILRQGRRYIIRAALLVVAAACIFNAAAGNSFKDAEIVFVDVGQGDCMHIRTEDGRNYLIDGGGSISYDIGKKTLKPYLLKNGARCADGAFVTHLHTDHYKGIAELCREGMVDRLFLYEGNRVNEEQILEETGLEKEDITYLYKGQTVILGESASVKVLWPERRTERQYEAAAMREEDENDSSMILKATVMGCSMLATADVDEACLDTLAVECGKALDSDVLKAAHHGSKYSYSEAFTEETSPGYTVFQVGKNNFGHPDKGIIENYLGKGIMVYRNDEDGAVAFDVDRNGRIGVRTVKGEMP